MGSTRFAIEEAIDEELLAEARGVLGGTTEVETIRLALEHAVRDEDLLAQARKVLGGESKGETIRLALEQAVRSVKLHKVLAHQGNVGIQLTPAALRKMRGER